MSLHYMSMHVIACHYMSSHFITSCYMDKQLGPQKGGKNNNEGAMTNHQRWPIAGRCSTLCIHIPLGLYSCNICNVTMCLQPDVGKHFLPVIFTTLFRQGPFTWSKPWLFHVVLHIYQTCFQQVKEQPTQIYNWVQTDAFSDSVWLFDSWTQKRHVCPTPRFWQMVHFTEKWCISFWQVW